MILGLCTIIVIYPLYLIVIASVSEPYAVLRGEVMLYPRDIDFIGYQKLLANGPIWVAYRNTVIYTTVGTVLNLTLTMMAGYALTRKFYGKKGMNFYFIFVMIFNAGLIPTFLQVRDLGLYNSPFIMVIMGAISVWNVMIARSFIKNSIPEELYEASAIDGCSHFNYFFRSILPLSKAIIGVLAVFYAVGHWNNFMTGLIYLRSRSYFPFQVILRELLTVLKANASMEALVDMVSNSAEAMRVAEVIKYCAIVVSTVPVLVLYICLQKYFVKGVMIGSIKG